MATSTKRAYFEGYALGLAVNDGERVSIQCPYRDPTLCDFWERGFDVANDEFLDQINDKYEQERAKQ